MAKQHVLTAWREKKKIPQAVLAKALGYSSAQFISNIERGISQLPTSKFKKTTKILGVPMEALIDMKLENTKSILRRALKI